MLVGDTVTIGILGCVIRGLVSNGWVGAVLDFVAIIDAVAIGIGLIRVGTDLNLSTVSQTILIRVSLRRIRRLIVVLTVLGTIQLLLIGQAVTIGIRLERISTLFLLLTVG